MIPFDFAYYRPESIEEAANAFHELSRSGNHPVYYGGGTEIITLGRVNQLVTEAVLDLKGIPECCMLDMIDNQLVIGAAVSITKVTESGLFPLFTESAGRVADHTSRGKITVGGNICSNFMYKEAVLSLLVADSTVVIAGPAGTRTMPLADAFGQRLHLEPGEFLVQIRVDSANLALPHRGVKKTKGSRINYPLISVAMLQKDQHLRLAVSGLCTFPFRSRQIEDDLNDTAVDEESRVQNALGHLPAPIIDDLEGSAGYREFVFRNTLHDILTKF